MNLLQIDASPRQDSVSRQLTSAFAKGWKDRTPHGRVTHRDLANSPVSAITEDWIYAAHSNPQQHTKAQRDAIHFSDQLVAELQAADVIVIGDPMHNFGISGRLKAWIDQVVRAGRTFNYVEGRPEGLLKGKKVYVLTSRGGAYAGTPYAQFDFQEPYLRHILAFIGLTDVIFIHAENQGRPDLAPAGRATALQQIASLSA